MERIRLCAYIAFASTLLLFIGGAVCFGVGLDNITMTLWLQGPPPEQTLYLSANIPSRKGNVSLDQNAMKSIRKNLEKVLTRVSGSEGPLPCVLIDNSSPASDGTLDVYGIILYPGPVDPTTQAALLSALNGAKYKSLIQTTAGKQCLADPTATGQA